MEDRNRRQRHAKARSKRSPLLIAGITAVVLAVLLFVLVYFANQNIEIQLNGGTEPVTLVYGKDTYQEQGATATVNGKPLEVTIESDLDSTKLGVYKVLYSAQHLWMKVQAEREVRVIDTTAPTITLTTDPTHITKPGEPYQEEGFTAVDDYDGDITAKVERTEANGKVVYKVKDSSGNEAVVEREIKYADVVAPELVLSGNADITLQAGESYKEPGFTATDDVDGDITDRVQITGDVDTNRAGTYTLTYTVTDSFGNKTEATRIIRVNPIKQPSVVEPGGKTIYLTFDDGPGVHTQALLDILAKYNVKATFFLVNTDYNMNSLLNKMVDAGHSIGIHSINHEYSEIYASDEAFFKDLYGMQKIIEDYTGVKTMLMRFPGGSSNRVSLNYCDGIMTRLTQAVQDQGFRYFDWNVSSGDVEISDTETIANNIISGIKGKTNAVVLQHDIYSASVAAVEDVIIWGLQNGYTFRGLTTSSPTCHHPVKN